MRILLCNTLENKGGAAKATQRILGSLREKGVDVKLLVAYKESQDKSILTNEKYLFRKFQKLIPKIDAIPKLLFSKDRKIPFSSSLFSYGFRNIVSQYNPDILHLNYINMGMFSIKDIGSFNMPVVWTLHDSWTFTGGCHLPNECRRYINRCGNCPSLCSQKENDLSQYILSQKKRHWAGKNITLVCPSVWIAENSRKSELFKNSRIEVIPNPIDTRVYRPKDRNKSREKLGLDKNKKYILFGAVNAVQDKNKGFEYLKEALEKISIDNVELLVFGSEDQGIDVNIPVKYLGYIDKEEDLVSIYSSADVTVIPSISENLPNVMVESLACGTPVVGFEIGGIPDIVKEDYLGLMATPYDSNDLVNKIESVLLNTLGTVDMRHTYVKNNYDYKVISEKYINLYKSLLNQI